MERLRFVDRLLDGEKMAVLCREFDVSPPDWFGRRKVNLSQVFAGQNVGVREVADHIWLISFMHYDLGFFDDQCTRVECAPNPFSAKVSAMSPV
jgi:hypothetical protein